MNHCPISSRLHSDLERLIASKAPGEKLPSEPELAHEFGVSRATLREAMRTFEMQGLIQRRQGAGTFITAPRVIDSGLEILESIETIAKRLGLEVSWHNLNVERVPAGEEERRALALVDESEVTRISRVVRAGNRAIAYLVDLLPVEVLLPSELDDTFHGSVLDFLLKRGTPPLHFSRTEISASSPPLEVMRQLNLHRSDVLIVFKAYLYSTEGKVVDYSHSYFLPGFFRFHVVRRVGH